jgi:hypothetical protein
MSALLAAAGLTLRFNSWHLPALIMLAAFIAFLVVAWLESREGGDYSIPIFSFVFLCIFLAVTMTAWTVFFLS